MTPTHWRRVGTTAPERSNLVCDSEQTAIREVTVVNTQGLHLRPAMKFVDIANQIYGWAGAAFAEVFRKYLQIQNIDNSISV